jgi:hypothetical protein
VSSPRVRVLFITSGIRAVLSYNLNIICSSPSHASLGSQPAAGTPTVLVHHSSPAQMSSSLSEAVYFPRSSPPLVRHVRRTVSALGRLERATPAGGRGCRGRGTRASGSRNCSDGGKGGKADDGGTGSSKGKSRAAAAADAAHAVAAELEALRSSSTGSSVSADDDRDNELKLVREAAWEQATQWAAAHLQGRRGGSPDGHRHTGGASGRGTGGGSPDRRGCTDC